MGGDVVSGEDQIMHLRIDSAEQVCIAFDSGSENGDGQSSA